MVPWSDRCARRRGSRPTSSPEVRRTYPTATVEDLLRDLRQRRRPAAGMTPRTVAIIQARMGSTRLPGKVLLPLLGAPLLGTHVPPRRARPAVDAAVVATTPHPRTTRSRRSPPARAAAWCAAARPTCSIATCRGARPPTPTWSSGSPPTARSSTPPSIDRRRGRPLARAAPTTRATPSSRDLPARPRLSRSSPMTALGAQAADDRSGVARARLAVPLRHPERFRLLRGPRRPRSDAAHRWTRRHARGLRARRADLRGPRPRRLQLGRRARPRRGSPGLALGAEPPRDAEGSFHRRTAGIERRARRRRRATSCCGPTPRRRSGPATWCGCRTLAEALVRARLAGDDGDPRPAARAGGRPRRRIRWTTSPPVGGVGRRIEPAEHRRGRSALRPCSGRRRRLRPRCRTGSRGSAGTCPGRR